MFRIGALTSDVDCCSDFMMSGRTYKSTDGCGSRGFFGLDRHESREGLEGCHETGIEVISAVV